MIKSKERTILDESRSFNEAAHLIVVTVAIMLAGKFIEGWLLIGMILIVCIRDMVLHGFYKRKIVNYETGIEYDANFKTLLEDMTHRIGADLRQKVGDYYVFGTNYRFAQNFNFYVKDCGSSCEIIVPPKYNPNIFNILNLERINIDNSKGQSKLEARLEYQLPLSEGKGL